MAITDAGQFAGGLPIIRLRLRDGFCGPELRVRHRLLFDPRRQRETFEQWRQRMLDETSAFIEWGLRNQDKVPWIPTHRVGYGRFSDRLKEAFWALVLEEDE